MSAIIVSPLGRIAEMAVRHHAKEMISLMAEDHAFHRPAVIAADRHLLLGMNDISFGGGGKLVAPQESHVKQIIDFALSWDQGSPLLIHCWMGVSRSPAAALIAALAVRPDLGDEMLVERLRRASPQVTPNTRLVAFGDAMLERGGRLIAAVKKAGRGADSDGNLPFVLDLDLPAAG